MTKIESGAQRLLDGMFSLEGQVALVTGAGRGLGLEMARALAAAGATVFLGGRDSDRLARAVQLIDDEGGHAVALPFDMEDAERTAGAIDRILREQGRLDILIANAGIRDRSGFGGLSRASLARLLDTNLIATTDLAYRAGLAMAQGGRGGRIIVIGSLMASIATTIDPAYLASKAALSGMMRALAAEFGPKGITVNEIAPGSFQTEFNAALAADSQTHSVVQSRTLLERWGKPEEIASAALFLASPGAAYVTGHRLLVDGGMSVKA